MREKKAVVQFVLTVLSIVLALLPFSAKLMMAQPKGNGFPVYYSFFSFNGVGYGQFGPFCCAVLLCIIFILEILIWRKQKDDLYITSFICYCLAILSLLSVCRFSGIEELTIIECIIIGMLFAKCFLYVFADHRKNGRSHKRNLYMTCLIFDIPLFLVLPLIFECFFGMIKGSAVVLITRIILIAIGVLCVVALLKNRRR